MGRTREKKAYHFWRWQMKVLSWELNRSENGNTNESKQPTSVTMAEPQGKQKHTPSTKFTNLNEFVRTNQCNNNVQIRIRMKLPKIAQLVVLPFTKQNVFYHEIKVKFVGFGFHFSIYRCHLYSVALLFLCLCATFPVFVLPVPFVSFVSFHFYRSDDNSDYLTTTASTCVFISLFGFGECEKGWTMAIRQTLPIKINVHVFILRHAPSNVPHFCMCRVVFQANFYWIFNRIIESNMILELQFECEFKFTANRVFAIEVTSIQLKALNSA